MVSLYFSMKQVLCDNKRDMIQSHHHTCKYLASLKQKASLSQIQMPPKAADALSKIAQQYMICEFSCGSNETAIPCAFHQLNPKAITNSNKMREPILSQDDFCAQVYKRDLNPH